MRVVAKIIPGEIDSLVDAAERRQIPTEIDGQLLGGARGEIGRDLSPDEKKDIRKYFAEECRKRLS